MTDSNPAIPHHPETADRLDAGLPDQFRSVDVNPALREELHYRQLERAYYQSAQYAAMVERYPLLRSSIAACRSMGLVSDAPPSAPRAAAHLHWERSHGEG